MKEMTGNDDFERFRTGSAKYAACLETHEGRLRLRAVAPKRLEQGTATQKIGNASFSRSMLNGPTLSWKVLLWRPWR